MLIEPVGRVLALLDRRLHRPAGEASTINDPRRI
jgi:hypothetical protein